MTRLSSTTQSRGNAATRTSAAFTFLHSTALCKHVCPYRSRSNASTLQPQRYRSILRAPGCRLMAAQCRADRPLASCKPSRAPVSTSNRRTARSPHQAATIAAVRPMPSDSSIPCFRVYGAAEFNAAVSRSQSLRAEAWCRHSQAGVHQRSALHPAAEPSPERAQAGGISSTRKV